MITTVRAVISQSPDCTGQSGIVGSHSPGVAQCPEILSRIKAQSCRVAQSAGNASPGQPVKTRYRPYRLSIILDNLQSVFRCKTVDFRRPASRAVKMNDHYGFCPLGDCFFNFFNIEIQCHFRRLHKNRFQPVVSHRKDSSYIRICRDNHLIPLYHQYQIDICTEHHPQLVQSVAARHSIAGTAQRGDFTLETFYILPVQEPP